MRFIKSIYIIIRECFKLIGVAAAAIEESTEKLDRNSQVWAKKKQAEIKKAESKAAKKRAKQLAKAEALRWANREIAELKANAEPAKKRRERRAVRRAKRLANLEKLKLDENLYESDICFFDEAAVLAEKLAKDEEEAYAEHEVRMEKASRRKPRLKTVDIDVGEHLFTDESDEYADDWEGDGNSHNRIDISDAEDRRNGVENWLTL